MTERRNDKRRAAQDSELGGLYRAARDVEPDSGLDRIVRVRAEQVVRTGRPANWQPWLGGLVTASVAIVAIALVLQQAPPGAPVPESTSPRASGEPQAFMAPSMGAQSQQKARREAPDVAATARAERDMAGESLRQSDRAPVRQPAPELMTPSARGRGAAEESEASPPASTTAGDRTVVTGARIDADNQRPVRAREMLIAKLREMIADQNIEQARRLLEEAVELDPELDVPDEIERALSLPAAENSGNQNPGDG